MHTTLIHVHVQRDHVVEFIDATRRNRESSMREPGNIRFDVLQSEADPTRFLLLEIFRDEASAAAHKTTPHYLFWREQVAAWMATPREPHRYRLLAPEPPSRP